MCIFSIKVPPASAMTRPKMTYTAAAFAPKMEVKITRLPKSTMGDEIKRKRLPQAADRRW